MWIQRQICSSLERCARQFPVLLLTGARQVGKTSLLRQMFPAHGYATLDVPEAAALAEQSPAVFLAGCPPPVIIDEVQYSPGILRHLKVAVDQDRHAMGQYLLTGSQKLALMQGVSESLAGRVAVFDLEGVSGSELLAAERLKRHPASVVPWITRGSFPELWRQSDLDRNRFLSSYLVTYLERDLRQVIQVGKLREFERFMRLLATRTGQLLNKSDLARDVGISVPTVEQWLSALEATNQVVLLSPYFRNVGKRVIKAPKVYFCDTGFAAFLLGIDEGTLETSPFFGALLESLVFGELRKSLAVAGSASTVWFYRDQRNREVDFVLQTGAGVALIEVKAAQYPNAHDTQSMHAVAALLESEGERVASRTVVCRTDTSYPLDERTMALSVFDVREMVA